MADPEDAGSIVYTDMDAETMNPGVWKTTPELEWLYDMGYGYVEDGSTYLLMNDVEGPFTKMIDPATGSCGGSLQQSTWGPIKAGL